MGLEVAYDLGSFYRQKLEFFGIIQNLIHDILSLFHFFSSFFFSVTIFATRFYIGYSPGGESGRRNHNGGGGGGRLVEPL